MKKWNDIADEFSYSKHIPWPTMSQAVLAMGGVPFATPGEQKHMVLEQRDKQLEKLKKDNPGKSPAEIFNIWKAQTEPKIAPIKPAAEGIGRLGVGKIRSLRSGAQPRPDANAVGMALGALHTDMGGLEAPKATDADVNPKEANPPLEEGEKFGPPDAIQQQAANWNIFVDQGFVEGELMKPKPPGAPGAPAAARKEDSSNPAAGAAKIPSSGGSPLPGAVRSRMEPKLGDLSGVKIHTGAKSGEAATKLGAKAFTVGQDVHFGAGEFQPGSKEGDRLLAHELTHTVQAQKSGIQRKPEDEEKEQKEGGAGEKGGAEGEEAQVSQPGDPAEKEADEVADNVTEGLHDKKEDKKGGDKKGGDKKGEKGGDKGAAKEEAPKVGAKLTAATVFSHVGAPAVIARKENDGGDKKDDAGGDKGGEKKEGGGAEAKGGDAKGEKGDDEKGGDKKDVKGGDEKGGDKKGGDAKGEKGGDEKGGDKKDAKGGDEKGGDKKDAKGGDKKDAKGGGDKKDAKGGDEKKKDSSEKKPDDAPEPEEAAAEKEGGDKPADEPKEAAPAVAAKLSGSGPTIFRATTTPAAAPAGGGAAAAAKPVDTEQTSMKGTAHTVKADAGTKQATVDGQDIKAAAAATKAALPPQQDPRSAEANAAVDKINQVADQLRAKMNGGTAPTLAEIKALSVQVATAIKEFGDKFKVERLGAPLPDFPKPVVGPHPVTGPETPDGSARNSHHAPPVKLSEMFADELRKVGSSLTTGKNKKELTPAGQQMVNAAQAVSDKGHGEGLTAILIHNATHKTAEGAAVHSSAMVDEINKRLTPICDATQQERIKIMNDVSKTISVNPRQEQFDQFLEACRAQADKIVDAAKKAQAKEATTQAEAKEKLATEKAQKDATPEAAKGVKELMNVAFNNALDQSCAALQAALSVSFVDGKPDERTGAVGEVRTQAPAAWAPILNAAGK